MHDDQDLMRASGAGIDCMVVLGSPLYLACLHCGSTGRHWLRGNLPETVRLIIELRIERDREVSTHRHVDLGHVTQVTMLISQGGL